MQSNEALTLDFKINWRILLILGIIAAMLLLAFSAVAAQVISNGNGIMESNAPQGAVQQSAANPSVEDYAGIEIFDGVLPANDDQDPNIAGDRIENNDIGIQNPNGSLNP